MQHVDRWSYKRGVERIQLTVKVYLERATFTWYWGNHLTDKLVHVWYDGSITYKNCPNLDFEEMQSVQVKQFVFQQKYNSVEFRCLNSDERRPKVKALADVSLGALRWPALCALQNQFVVCSGG